MIFEQRLHPKLSTKNKYGLAMGHNGIRHDGAAVYGIYVDGKLMKWGQSRHVKGRMKDYQCHKHPSHDAQIRTQMKKALRERRSVHVDIYHFRQTTPIVQELKVHGSMHNVKYVDGDAASLERALRNISIQEGHDEPWEKKPRGDIKYRIKRS